ncbi:hypothetical protein AALO_G00153590 [Alosa alosa]|uniref:Uncharacterized protein n=1 Tax=Alosa alosa TaxID=278164 RepID=A0AAV6GFQ1_9TELE|nr:uncharacterized protein LOC125303680 [Alosa alosa]KAG5273625.1 hypothetical protein AALO_G00153590 [Alosa alosa]
MPRPVIESNSAHLYPRERAPPVSLDWIDGKNVRLLRVANHREAFRFKKLSQALSTIENLHKACWLREEKRVRQSLRRLVSVSPPCSSQTLFKRSSDACSKASVRGDSVLELPPCVVVRGGGGGGGGGEEGSVAPVQSQQSTAMASPCSGYKGLLPTLPNAPLTSLTPPAHNTPRSATPSTSHRSSAFPSSLMMGAGGTEMGMPGPLLPTPSLLALLPPHLSPELHGLQEAVLGFPLLQKRVRELIAHARQVEQERQERRSVTLKPLEALRCRYLRLSESNISTLLELCKESGVDVDIHPHMKDSDIDISNLFKSLSSPSSSTELM